MPRSRTRERDSAQVRRFSRSARLAIGLAVVGGIIALVIEILKYRRSGFLELGRVALAVVVPLLIYVTVRTAARRNP